jgi:hypothetical protein
MAEGRSVTVMRAWRIRAASRRGESRACGGASTSRAPASSDMNISITDASKFSEANWSTMSAGPSCQVVIMPCRKLSSWRCSTTTPLGWPVEPEV